jgi:hypothetical protein
VTIGQSSWDDAPSAAWPAPGNTMTVSTKIPQTMFRTLQSFIMAFSPLRRIQQIVGRFDIVT